MVRKSKSDSVVVYVLECGGVYTSYIYTCYQKI